MSGRGLPRIYHRGSAPDLQFGHFRRGTNVEPEVDAWIAAQRLNRLAQVL